MGHHHHWLAIWEKSPYAVPSAICLWPRLSATDMDLVGDIASTISPRADLTPAACVDEGGGVALCFPLRCSHGGNV